MNQTVPLNLSAVSLARSLFGDGHRVLILGASGWLGKTAISMIRDSGAKLLLVGSYPRKIVVNGHNHEVVVWSEEKIESFRPNVVIDFAFLTHEFLEIYGPDEFVSVNKLLTARALWALGIRSVAWAFTVSSGATESRRESEAVREESKELYGLLKAEHDKHFQERASEMDVTSFVAKAWSLSGGFVGPSHSLALSDFVRMAKRDRRIEIRADRPVYRRYCSVEDFLSVAWYGMFSRHASEFHSGGNLIELRDLARLVAQQCSDVSIVESSNDWQTRTPASYASDNLSWSAALKASGIRPLSLSEQVRNVWCAIK